MSSPPTDDAIRGEGAVPNAEPTSAPGAAPPSSVGGIIDERDFDAVLDHHVIRARNERGMLSLVVVELVGAPLPNGHVFREAIELLHAHARDVDVIAGQRNDQIAIILPGLNPRETASFTMMTRELLTRHRFGPNGHALFAFVSGAGLEPQFARGWELFAAAQRKLDHVMRNHPTRDRARFNPDHCQIERRSQETDACIVVIYGAEPGRKYHIGEHEMTIGRATVNDICLAQGSVSRTHATVTYDYNGVKIRDNESTHGTYVNGVKIRETYLKNGDFIKVGRSILKTLIGDDVESSCQEEISRLSNVDGLTQVFNKRYFTDTLERELKRARRYDRPLALMMLDIDGFARCNATYGHDAGDYVLRQVAELVRDRSRKVDVVARYGDDELAVILPELDLHGAAELAETIRAQIEQTRFVFEDQPIALTISVGVTELEPHIATATDLVEAAIARLARAK